MELINDSVIGWPEIQFQSNMLTGLLTAGLLLLTGSSSSQQDSTCSVMEEEEEEEPVDTWQVQQRLRSLTLNVTHRAVLIC